MITRSGRAVLAATTVLVAAGWSLGYPELLALGLGGVVVLLAAIGWMGARPRVRIARRVEPARVMEGDGARGILTVTNVGRRRSPPFRAVEAVGDQRVPVSLPSLRAGDSSEVDYPLPTGRRGRYSVGPLTVGHSDPFGLLYAARSYPSRSTLRVTPRLHPVAPLPTGRSRDMDGRTSAAAPRGGVAFHSLREYERGDDLRLVHWRSTARTGTLMVRHMVVPHEPRMLIVLDTSAAPYTDTTFEDAVRVAASLAISAFDGGYPVEVRTTGGAHAQAERGESHRAVILDLFAEAGRADGDPGLAALTGLGPVDDGTALGVVTGNASPASLAAVTTVGRRYAMVSVALLRERRGAATPVLAGAFAVGGATSEDLVAVWNRAVRR